MDKQKQMEEDVRRALFHESGHAAMAVLQKIKCDDIYYLKDRKNFCTVAYFLPQLSKEDYMFYAGGVAAERIVYGREDVSASAHDRIVFEKDGAPGFEETVSEAKSILLSKLTEIETIKMKLWQAVARGGLGCRDLPDIYKVLSDCRGKVCRTYVHKNAGNCSSWSCVLGIRIVSVLFIAFLLIP
jgi:hypothetical protein